MAFRRPCGLPPVGQLRNSYGPLNEPREACGRDWPTILVANEIETFGRSHAYRPLQGRMDWDRKRHAGLLLHQLKHAVANIGPFELYDVADTLPSIE